jgi:hypothetical protein
MARETTYKGTWGDWQGLLAKVEANSGELPQLEPFRVKLGGILTQVLSISRQQDAMRASKQEASKQLRKLITEGNRVAALMRVGIKEHYGPQEEKVAEFGLQPFRGRKVKPAPATPVPQTPAPETPETPALPAPTKPNP